MRIQRSPFKPRAKAGIYKIDAKSVPDEATVYLYDEIGWFGVSAEQFVKDLNDISANTIHVRFNTPGGSVFDGTAIFNAVKQHKSKVIAHIDGLAASISSVIAMAADEIVMSENAFLMIHDPWSIVIGNSDIMRDEADLLDKVGGVIAKAYMDKTGKDEKEIKSMMSSETWMTADEALEMGFVNSIDKDDDDKKDKVKSTLFDLSVFANVPDKLLTERQAPTARDLERVLRDAGCTRAQAKEVLASGLRDFQRDVDNLEIQTPEASICQRDVDEVKDRQPEAKAQNEKDQAPVTDNYDVLKLIDSANKAMSKVKGDVK